MRLLNPERNMTFFCRRTVTLAGQEFLPGQVLPHERLMAKHGITWRKLCTLYDLRRIVTESDPFFEELMKGAGMRNNPKCAAEWLGLNCYMEPEAKDELDDEDLLLVSFDDKDVEVRQSGVGWYDVFVDGECITPKRLRKQAAEALAKKERS